MEISAKRRKQAHACLPKRREKTPGAAFGAGNAGAFAVRLRQGGAHRRGLLAAAFPAQLPRRAVAGRDGKGRQRAHDGNVQKPDGCTDGQPAVYAVPQRLRPGADRAVSKRRDGQGVPRRLFRRRHRAHGNYGRRAACADPPEKRRRDAAGNRFAAAACRRRHGGNFLCLYRAAATLPGPVRLWREHI